MSRTLPPMLAIRAFEAAARHGSFVRAGEELCVSAGAVGHQVRLLEEWLGRPLFERKARSVELNESGRRYFVEVHQLLEELERASLALRRTDDDTQVTVTAMPSFVTRWLMPRLGRFTALHPHIEVRVLGSVPPVDFARDHVDLAIRLGVGTYPGLVSDMLLPETYHAVAHPSLAAQICRPADVTAFALLHDEYEQRIPAQVDWPRWCAAQGLQVPAQRLRQGLRFSHTYLTLDAAAAGAGLAVASDVLAGEALKLGQLQCLPGAPVKGPSRYYLVHPPAAAHRPQVQAVCDWLRQEAADFRRDVRTRSE